MFQRLTQTEEYWVNDLSIEDDDLDYVNNLLLEEERPLLIEGLALAFMSHRAQQEEDTLQTLLAQGTVFQPSGSFQEGELLVFPALNFSTGTVVGIRPGFNPEYGEFQVIIVEFDRSRRKREFASELNNKHPLNEETAALAEEDKSLTTVEELHRLYGKHVANALKLALEEQADLVQLFGLWFLKALVTEVGPGYLNIAEAILDIAEGGPLAAPDLLRDLGLPDESRPELLEFSLNYALFQDERFDEVGPAGQVLWYLRRLEPPEVLYPPRRLAFTPVPYQRDLLNLSLRKLEQELDDEWSQSWEVADTPERVQFTLTFPHWQQGTIPLTSRIAPLFPTSYQAPRIRCTFIDSHTDQEMEAWVVWEGRFVHGLGEWYQKYSLPVGAFLHIGPGPAPGVVIIEF